MSIVLYPEEQDLRDTSTGVFPLVEHFVTIQGEGPWMGRKSLFLRFGGCPRRCSWCDSMHAVMPDQVKKNATRLTTLGLTNLVDTHYNESPFPTITLTGGDPCMWNLLDFVRMNKLFEIGVETQGDIWQPWLTHLSMAVMSPKPPSAGFNNPRHKGPDVNILSTVFGALGPESSALKVVIFNDDDLEFALELHDKFSSIPFYLSVGTPVIEPSLCVEHADQLQQQQRMVLKGLQELARKVIDNPGLQRAIVSPQLHVLMGVA